MATRTQGLVNRSTQRRLKYAAAFLQFKQAGKIPRRDLILALTTGEEGGTFYNGMDWLVKNHQELIDAE